MSEDLRADQVCRAEGCPFPGIHAKHRKGIVRVVEAHHRPGGTPWKAADPDGLAEAILKAVSERTPKWFQEIAPDVRDDYGNITDRTIWRGLRKLVDAGKLLRLDLGLAFSAYMRPVVGKRPAGSFDSVAEMREYMLGVVEIHPTKRESY